MMLAVAAVRQLETGAAELQAHEIHQRRRSVTGQAAHDDERDQRQCGGDDDQHDPPAGIQKTETDQRGETDDGGGTQDCAAQGAGATTRATRRVAV